VEEGVVLVFADVGLVVEGVVGVRRGEFDGVLK
jgi:hypothetical protein